MINHNLSYRYKKMIETSCYQVIPTIDINDNIIIRNLSIEDAPAYLNYMRNPKVNQYVLVEKKPTMSYAISHINYCHNMIRSQEGLFWSITTKKDNTMIGWLGLYINNHNHRAEIAFDLSEDFWGQGIITKVIHETLRYGFQHLNLIRISALILKENIGSQKALEKNHFSFEGTLKNYKLHLNKAYDIESYAITNKKFEQKKKN